MTFISHINMLVKTSLFEQESTLNNKVPTCNNKQAASVNSSGQLSCFLLCSALTAKVAEVTPLTARAQ